MKTLSDIIEYKKEEVNIKKKLLTLTQIKEESSNRASSRQPSRQAGMQSMMACKACWLARLLAGGV